MSDVIEGMAMAMEDVAGRICFAHARQPTYEELAQAALDYLKQSQSLPECRGHEITIKPMEKLP